MEHDEQMQKQMMDRVDAGVTRMKYLSGLTGRVPRYRCAKCSLLADISEPVARALMEKFAGRPRAVTAALLKESVIIAYLTVDHEPTCGA